MSVLIEFRVRRDTATNWSGTNPILGSGEIGYDTTNHIFKVGNNTSTWNQLPAVSTAINSGSITWEKLQDFATHSRLLGSPSNSDTPQEILIGSGLNMSGNTLSATSLGIGITVRNETGVTLAKGSAVRISGASGNKPLISLAQANAYSTTEVIGVLAAPIANNAEGTAIVYGEISDINTSGLTAGLPVYLSPTVAGGLTATEPDPPNFQVQIGFCEVVNNNNGKIVVAIRHEFTKSEYISDSTTVGRALLTAVDATAAKNTLGIEKNTNVTIGPGAGDNLTANSESGVLIGKDAGTALTLANLGIIAIGENAGKALVSGVGSYSNTTPGTGGIAGTYNEVELDKASGTDSMTVYPKVNLTVNSSGAVSAPIQPITEFVGSGLTGTNLILKAKEPVPTGVPTDWRATVTTSAPNGLIAIGANALSLGSPATGSTAIGAYALENNTAGVNTAVGWWAMRLNTTGNLNSGLGRTTLYYNTTGTFNTGIGVWSGFYNTTGSYNTNLGANTLYNAVGSNNVAIGHDAGRYTNSGSNATAVDNSILIGKDARPSGNTETNQIVIGYEGRGNGSNTTTLGNLSTTATYIAGTATSLFSIAGDTMRITGTRNPASNAAGTAGDFCFGTDGGTTYLYYCIANANWGRVALTTGY